MADRSVRTAWADDATAIGAVQARAWRRSYGAVLPAAALDEVDADDFADAWRAAITKPPSARHRVLVALEGNQVVGFAATAPSEDPDAEAAEGEIVAFHVDPAALGAGHGPPFLPATVDTPRADRVAPPPIWL